MTTTVPTLPDPSFLALFGIGALVMRGAGCTINDMWDRDIDRQVVRTDQRPLASGAVSLEQATAWLAVQLTAGLAILLSLPSACWHWGCAALPLVVVYPATKRFFAYPQLVLGLTMNWGVLVGWAAATADPSSVAMVMPPASILLFYGSGVTWTLLYDTMYAHQDKEDDARLQLHSTALAWGDDKNILYGFATLTALQWVGAGLLQPHLALVPYLTGIGASYAHLLWQVKTADLTDPHNLAERFRSNSTVGMLVFLAVCSGVYFA